MESNWRSIVNDQFTKYICILRTYGYYGYMYQLLRPELSSNALPRSLVHHYRAIQYCMVFMVLAEYIVADHRFGCGKAPS